MKILINWFGGGMIGMFCNILQAGIGLPEYERHNRYHCGFFVREFSALRYVGLGRHSKEWPVLVPVDQPTQSGTLIGLRLSGIKTFYETKS